MQAPAPVSRLRVPVASSQEVLAALPLLAAVAVVLAWTADGGGFAATSWYPGALVVLGLAAVGFVGAPARLPGLDRRTAASLGLFAAFTLWTFASIAWATAKGEAWDGANRTLLYLTVFALFASARLTRRSALWLVTVYGAGVATVGLVTVERALHAADPSGFFLYSRLSAPTGYSNATAALYLVPVWPLLYAAARRRGNPLHRGLALGLAGVLVQLALVPQSRGAVFSLPVVALAFLLLVPGRLRNGVALAAVGAAVGLARGPILAVYSHPPGDPAFHSTLASARTTLLATLAGLAVAGAAAAVVDSRLELPARPLALARRVAAVAVAAAVVAASGVALARHGGPGPALRSAWHSFKGDAHVGSTRFVSLGSNRYDFWRVSLDIVRRHPVGGVGAGNFSIQYLRQRRSSEEPLYPHSIEMQLLEQTGVVGTLLFVGAIALALAAALRRRAPGATASARGLAAAMAVGFGYWLLHASVDWLWEFPALTAGAFALLGGAVALRRPEAGEPRRPGRRAGRLAVAGIAALVVLAVPSYGLPWLADVEVNAAAGNWRAHPDRAAAQLRLARRLNPLTDTPDVIGAVISSRRRDYARMRLYLRAAIARNPHNWYSHLDLAAAESMLGATGAALREAREARRLNPGEPLAASAVRTLEAGGKVDPARLDAVLLWRDRHMR